MILQRKSHFKALMMIVGCWVVFSTMCCRGKSEAISWKKLKGIGSSLRSLFRTRFFVFSLLLVFFSEVAVHVLNCLHLVLWLKFPSIYLLSILSLPFLAFCFFVWNSGFSGSMFGCRENKGKREERRKGTLGSVFYRFVVSQKLKILLKSAKRLCSGAKLGAALFLFGFMYTRYSYFTILLYVDSFFLFIF